MNSKKIGFLMANLFCVFTLGLNVYAVPGALDTSFDGDGKTTTQIGLGGEARDVLIQPDGKIVVTGISYSSVGDPDISLARYNTDGSLDTGFGTGGTVLLPESGNQMGKSVAIQADGKLLVVGHAVGTSSLPTLAVYRFNANGSVDTTFGTNGRVVHNFPSANTGNHIVLQPDGKMLIGASLDGKFTVFRLNSDGALDTSFNLIGYNSLNEPFNQAAGVAVVLLQPDGKIVAAGQAGSSGDAGLWTRFSSDGIAESSLIRTNFVIWDGAIQTDGKIVFAGRTTSAQIKHFGITRYNADKTLDTTFGNLGTNQVIFSSIFSLSQSEATALAIQPDGRIIVGGYNTGSINRDFALVRFNSSGFLDVGFGNSGKVLTAFGANSNEEIKTLALQPDGKVVTAGSTNVFGSPVLAVARYDAGASSTQQNRAAFDYDGDGRSDISVIRPSTNVWYHYFSFTSSVSELSFGASGDIPASADYDGDGRTDFGIYRPSTGQWWYILSSTNTVNVYNFGVTDGIPLPSDFDGDGRADYILYQPSTSQWHRRGSSGQTPILNFGIAEDKPLIGDFDGDGLFDPAVFRPSTGDWWYLSSVDGAHKAVHWGISTDIPAPADYDGDGKTDFAVYRPSEGMWYIYNSSDGSFTIMKFGLAEDKPVPADYDGDGKADIAVYRPSTGIWYLMRSTEGFSALQFGISTDIPIPNSFIP